MVLFASRFCRRRRRLPYAYAHRGEAIEIDLQLAWGGRVAKQGRRNADLPLEKNAVSLAHMWNSSLALMCHGNVSTVPWIGPLWQRTPLAPCRPADHHQDGEGKARDGVHHPRGRDNHQRLHGGGRGVEGRRPERGRDHVGERPAGRDPHPQPSRLHLQAVRDTGEAGTSSTNNHISNGGLLRFPSGLTRRIGNLLVSAW